MMSSPPTGPAVDESTPAPAPSAAEAGTSLTNPPAAMSYRERRKSQPMHGGGQTTGRRRTSSFGCYTRVVIVAVDASDNARHAFQWFLDNIWKLDDLIVLVHCPEAPKLPTFSFKSGFAPPVDEWKKILDGMNDRARKVEEDYETTCTMKKLKHKLRCEAMKNVGEGICRIADEEGADMIVCGARGSGGIKFGSKGSVCEYIMRNSPTPSVVVPFRK